MFNTPWDLRAHFQKILNRDDCDDALAEVFLHQGMTRLSRILRTEFQEQEAELTVDSATYDDIAIPEDFVVGIAVEVDGVPLKKLSQGQTGQFEGYVQVGKSFVLYPEPSDGQVVTVRYYGALELPRFAGNLGVGELVVELPPFEDCVLYHALVYAAFYFIDERLTTFTQAADMFTSEVDMATSEARMGGGSMVVTPYGGGIA